MTRRHALVGSGTLPKLLARPRHRAPQDQQWASNPGAAMARPQVTSYPIDSPALKTAPPQEMAPSTLSHGTSSRLDPARQVLQGPQSRGPVLALSSWPPLNTAQTKEPSEAELLRHPTPPHLTRLHSGL